MQELEPSDKYLRWIETEEDLAVSDWIAIKCPECSSYNLMRDKHGKEYCSNEDCTHGKELCSEAHEDF